MKEDRGVTEVLGYVLVIALITATIGVVMTTGISGLQASQEAEQVNNMERAFDVLAHNAEEPAHRGAPSRATELRLAGGSVLYGDPVRINVTIDDDPIQNVTIWTEPIVYKSGGDTEIVYEAGAIIRTQDDHSVMLRDPPIVLEEERVLVNGIRTRPLSGSPESLDREGTVLARKEFLGASVGNTKLDENETVKITVQSTRIDAWEAYFEDRDIGDVTSVEDDELVYEVNLEEGASVAVVESRLRVTFTR